MLFLKQDPLLVRTIGFYKELQNYDTKHLKQLKCSWKKVKIDK